MFLEDRENNVCTFEFVSLFVWLKTDIKVFPLFLYLLEGTLNFVLFPSYITGVIDNFGISYEVLLDIHLIKSKVLTLGVNIEVAFKLLPMPASYKRLPQTLNQRQNHFEVVNRGFQRRDNAPLLGVCLLAQPV